MSRRIGPEEIGTLLCTASGISLRLRGNAMPSTSVTQQIPVAEDPEAAYGYTVLTERSISPTNAEISMMDEVLSLLSRIPQDKFVLRKIVLLRTQSDPWSRKRLVSDAEISVEVGCVRAAVKPWFINGLRIISESVNKDWKLREKMAIYLDRPAGP